ncbi:MAG: hypothetical protein RR642_17205, partial [Solibacillus sp.]
MDFDKMKHAVKSIEMSKAMEKSVKANCKNAEREKMPRSNFKSRLSVACAFGIVMLMLVGIPFFSNNGDFQAANFAITAYALSDDGNQSNTKISSEKATFELSTEVRGSTTDITGDVGNLIFTKVMLNISGEHIDSITYTISKGKFIEDVTLTAKESTDKD